MSSVCIFGSVARKDQDSLSDKDALILFDGSETCKELKRQWSGNGWSVVNYTEKRLTKMADAGSLFVQHLKQEGIILEDANNVLSDLLASYEPKADYSSQITETVSALKLLERVPPSHELDYWSADLLHVLIRNLGILKLANEGIYEFSFRRIAQKLIGLSLIGADDIEVFEGLRSAKSEYRSGLLPFIPAGEIVEGGLRVVEKLCGVSLERNHSLDVSMPCLDQPYFNLRAIEKTLIAYNGLPKPNAPFSSPNEGKLWKRVMDPRTYSWDVKTRQSELWQLLLDTVNFGAYVKPPRMVHFPSPSSENRAT